MYIDASRRATPSRLIPVYNVVHRRTPSYTVVRKSSTCKVLRRLFLFLSFELFLRLPFGQTRRRPTRNSFPREFLTLASFRLPSLQLARTDRSIESTISRICLFTEFECLGELADNTKEMHTSANVRRNLPPSFGFLRTQVSRACLRV